MDVPVNYWAILACGVASMIIGSIWYGPLFGKIWAKLSGWDNLDTAKRDEMKKGMMKSYALAFIGALVMAYVLSHHTVFAGTYLKTEGISAGLQSGFWVWLGFVVPVTMSDVLWGAKSWKLWSINTFYFLVQLLVFGLILGGWR
ncbi:MAG: hypothetical protein A3I07_00060 [Candidatus Doudnabacteria bacterium RIFCSPLOWO2_02_FULL_42_9]|uniref:DUF1761 domain-containing protein n=1 Tax=Candidatus Doudnabacteria bacterium RIFCSPHIGHO2_01_FULL_41_86 TaxID=1817821 RepID=A0A1F5N8B8_9BACT|nr:MAG: hypothetical protein A2717_04580 [Candidatus Doudnabacteria bacterium RIFCSPHIGHO2_01_FULL_41_86]OGE75888.1 MAG: hypothetical protein A3K07_04175 [Candidatus Doudnabacteria bacterium RIFCSPHIGHO2_01_43_10]OGE86262.1 MAG: hypothetical protein A3E28_03935 [Candidatus Doudnabacteria bacterium RIFCSPHIGHO2_12_FULL_42_22]OGE87110.1 MAG: hypothetical protein A3C49_03600 [Candidatus Doudnabacteria bacterium RIFCSPHIGHO2_02_FULL_42_25]OGE92250.1 MAG: hypothetical protein A2895_04285 [Candidatus